jgi:hypothetical protein
LGGCINNIIIQTDFRIELLSTVIFLSDLDNDQFISKDETEYSRILGNEFNKYKNHQAVKIFPKLWEDGLRWDGVPQLALHLNNDLTKKFQFSNELKSRFNNSYSSLTDFLKLINDFSEKSNFLSFYNKSLKLNENFLLKLHQILNKFQIIKILENYLNIKLFKQKVMLSNLLKSSYGITINVSKNNFEIFCIASKYWLNVANSNGCLTRNLLSTIWHEFLHSIINPLSDKLFDDHLNLTDSQSEWYCELNESIIWAITLRLLIKEKIVDENNCNWYFNNAVNCGAPKTKELNDLLIEYESNQSKYNNFREFYPILQNEFGKPPRE